MFFREYPSCMMAKVSSQPAVVQIDCYIEQALNVLNI